MNKATAFASGALALLVVAGGAATASAFHREVTLRVDGQAMQAQAFGVTVADMLNANNIVLGPGDVVSPNADSVVTDGETITVSYVKHVTLTIDGHALAVTTKATTLAAAIDEVQAQLPDIDGARISVPVATALPRTGLDVAVTTPKKVQLVVAGKKAKKITTTSATVADLLKEQGLQTGANDRVAPTPGTELTDGLVVTLDRVKVTTKKVTEDVPFDTVTKQSPTLWKGETQVTTVGKVGQAARTYKITTVNGQVTDKVIMSEQVLVPPVNQVTSQGTKTSPNGVGLNLARAAQWDKIAKCESGRNWHINTGNGYYGGLQFNLQTWRSVHGQDFAARPDLATREQQITVANRLYAKRGFAPWTCRRVL